MASETAHRYGPTYLRAVHFALSGSALTVSHRESNQVAVARRNVSLERGDGVRLVLVQVHEVPADRAQSEHDHDEEDLVALLGWKERHCYFTDADTGTRRMTDVSGRV